MPKPQTKMHPSSWTTDKHYGMCGQSCPCCRSQVEEIPGFGTCPICDIASRDS